MGAYVRHLEPGPESATASTATATIAEATKAAETAHATEGTETDAATYSTGSGTYSRTTCDTDANTSDTPDPSEEYGTNADAYSCAGDTHADAYSCANAALTCKTATATDAACAKAIHKDDDADACPAYVGRPTPQPGP